MGTEKTAKKPAPKKKPVDDGKYHKTIKDEVAKFMGGQKLVTGAAKANYATQSRAGTAKVLGPDEQPNPENEAEANALGEVFAIINPIPSCVGPIGQFQVNIDHFPL